MVKALDSKSRGPKLKTTGWLKVDLAFDLSKIHQMSTRNFWEIGA